MSTTTYDLTTYTLSLHDALPICYFIKLLLKGPHPRVTMNKFKVAIPLVMKPGIEDIPVPGSFVERTGEFHRAGLVVKLFGPGILSKTFNPWGWSRERTAD